MTVLATRTVKAGRQHEFESFLCDLHNVFADAPGHLRLTGGIVKAPPRWKTWLLSACGIYPIITLITVFAGPLLAPLPPPARFAIVTPVLSGLMTWAVMPILTRLFARLLYPATP